MAPKKKAGHMWPAIFERRIPSGFYVYHIDGMEPDNELVPLFVSALFLFSLVSFLVDINALINVISIFATNIHFFGSASKYIFNFQSRFNIFSWFSAYLSVWHSRINLSAHVFAHASRKNKNGSQC